MKKLLIGFALLSFLGTFAFADNNSGKIYSWVDAKGITHYGENPPKDTPSRKLNARTGHSDPVDYETTEKKETKQEDKATASSPSPERCQLARNNLKVLQTSPRVKTTDANGENRYMTPDEMQAQVATMQEIITEECSGQ